MPPRVKDHEKRDGTLFGAEEMMTPSEQAARRALRARAGRSGLEIGVEGDFFFVGTTSDCVLYLGGDPLLALLRFFLRSPGGIRTHDEVEEKFGESGKKKVIRARSMLSRSFGGEWFTPEKGAWRLFTSADWKPVLKDNYVAPVKSTDRRWSRRNTRKPPDLELIRQVSDLTAEGKTAKEIGELVGKTPSYIGCLRSKHGIRSALGPGRRRGPRSA